jgi:hypothetical protein
VHDRRGREGDASADPARANEPELAPGKLTLTEQIDRAPATTKIGATTLTELAMRSARDARPASVDDVATAAIENKGSGRAVDPTQAAIAGAQLGVDVSHARVHDDPAAQQATRAMNARAFAHGSDVFLGPGESESDTALMAHELTHVAQQGGAQPLPQRKVTVGDADSPAERQADRVAERATGGATPERFLVDDGMAKAPDQIHKTQFLAQLRALATATASHELGRLGAAEDCPYIHELFARYATEPAARCEALLRRWVPMAPMARTIGELTTLTLTRVRTGVRTWVATGALPPEVAEADPAITAAIASDPRTAAGAVQRKSLEGLEAELGAGQPLEPATAARMSRAVGADVSGARIHTGATAQRMAADVDASAFAVGQNVVMGAAVPSSGPLADALLAHELVHTAQQKDAASDPVARKKPIGAEDEAAERDAGLARLGNFAGAVGDVMRTGLQLQRCPQNSSPQTTATVQPPAVMPAQMLEAAGDWFQVVWEDNGFEAVKVTYEGPFETVFNMRTVRLRVDYDRTRPLNPRVTADAASVVFDIHGDNSVRIVVRDEVVPGGANERAHVFTALVNGKDSGELSQRGIGLKLPSATSPAPAGTPADVVKRETPVTKHIDLLGDGFDFTARRIGTTSQVQLHVAGPMERGSIDDPILNRDPNDTIPLPAAPKALSLDIVGRGRDLMIDLDGDHEPDIHLVHTAWAKPMPNGKEQRVHLLRSFDMSGVFLKEHMFSKLGAPVAIPKDQDEVTRKPDLTKEWPANRPPAQADIPGEPMEVAYGPNGMRELRIDGDGDRSKELLLRFSYRDAGQVHMQVIQIGAAATEVRELGWKSTEAGGGIFSTLYVAQTTDGHVPTILELGSTKIDRITIQPATIADGKASYAVEVPGQKTTLVFPALPTPLRALVAGTPPQAAKTGDVTSYDLELADYGDRFRFQLEVNPARTTFSIRPLVGTQGVGAVEVPVSSWAKSLKLASGGDPRAIHFDLGRGPNDLVIYDRLEGTKDPTAERTHTLTLVGPGVAKETSIQFLAHGVLQAGHATGTKGGWSAHDTDEAVLARQADQGNFEGFATQIDAGLTVARKQAYDAKAITERTYKAWVELSRLIIQLDAQVASAKKDPTKHVDGVTKTMAAAAAYELQAAIDKESDRFSKKHKGKVQNNWTKRDDWNHKLGFGQRLRDNILFERWDPAKQNYRDLIQGLDNWIGRALLEHHDKKGSEQQYYMTGVARELRDIEKHAPIRVLATFTPDDAPENHVPLNLLVYRDDGDWHLKDLTNPKDPFDDTIDETPDQFPPDELFQKLNWKKHFPVGKVHYRLPGGRDGQVACTGKRKWYDWFADVSLALAAIGLAAATGGMGTVAAIALAGAGVTGAIAPGGDLADHIGHNHVSAGVVALDIAQIVGGFAGAGQVLSGRLIKVAAAADEAVAAGTGGAARVSGAWAQLANLAGKNYVRLTVASAGANTVTLAIMTVESIDALRAVVADPHLTPDERKVAITRILGQFILIGGITFMAVKGDLASAIEGEQAIEIVNVDGLPVVVRAGTKPTFRPQVGDPPVVARDGSLTKLGKQRLANVEPKVRKELVKLDQPSLGKLLTLDEAALAKVAALDEASLHTLTRFDEAAIGRIATLDDAALRAFLKLDAKAATSLSTLTATGLRNVMQLSDHARKAFLDVHGPFRDTLAELAPTTIDAIVARPKVVDALSKLKPDEAQHLFAKLDPVRTHPDVLWDVSLPTLRRMADFLTTAELERLASIGHDMAKLTHLHGMNLRNLAALPTADLAVVAKLDVATIDRVSRIPGDALVRISPLSEATIKTKLADVHATEAHVTAELGLPGTKHHLRETNFADRGVFANNGGQVRVIVPGKGKSIPIDSPSYLRLEPIPSPPAPHPTTIVSIEVTGPEFLTKSAAPGKTPKVVTGRIEPTPAGELKIPAPAPGLDITVTTSGGAFKYTNVEHPPAGTRISITPPKLAQDPVPGGHTRAAWDAAERTYGDSLTKTSDQGIKFKLPGSEHIVEMAEIRAEVTIPKKSAPVKWNDPKTIFENVADLNTFEQHMKPYMSAKISALKSSPMPPAAGDVITVAVPVRTLSGQDAIVDVEFPWRLDAGNNVIDSWWVAQTAFAKGSPFNP